jgi:hypothetical protein
LGETLLDSVSDVYQQPSKWDAAREGQQCSS